MKPAPHDAEDFGELRTPTAALVISILFTGVALLENTLLPWAPFYFAYAWLSTVLPMGVGGFTFGDFRSIRRNTWIGVVLLPFALQGLGAVWSIWLYPALLSGAGVEAASISSSAYDLSIALQEMLETAAQRWRTGVDQIQFYYFGGIFLWAGLGEELFYRGYLYTSLRSKWGVTLGAVASSALFGIRHATQLGLLGASYPWGAAFSWVVISFLVGLALCWLYEKSKSLLPSILAHYLLNLIPTASILLGPSS
ncbi:MAG: CPBP family intramembrane metalloprotease [Acidobacteria bacterium]|nr:CPBP family intramembrane metalloprotease [Acidobacteriota bacterium]MCI0567820.1 CPBP family intramembrane metalloprotease [Acidobacteriota bacterium]